MGESGAPDPRGLEDLAKDAACILARSCISRAKGVDESQTSVQLRITPRSVRRVGDQWLDSDASAFSESRWPDQCERFRSIRLTREA